MSEPPRRRDPERRRREIVDAAVAIVVEEGPDALTHRKVAARAGVPLGSTTQYFATLGDLRAAALNSIIDEALGWLGELEATFVREGASPSVYTAALLRYLDDPHIVRGDFAVMCAAPSHPELWELNARWAQAFTTALERYLTDDSARAVAIFTDGAIVNSVLTEQSVDPDLLERSLAALWYPVQENGND